MDLKNEIQFFYDKNKEHTNRLKTVNLYTYQVRFYQKSNSLINRDNVDIIVLKTVNLFTY